MHVMYLYKYMVTVKSSESEEIIYQDNVTAVTGEEAIRIMMRKFDGKSWDGKCCTLKYPLRFEANTKL